MPAPAKPKDLSPGASAVWDRILAATASTMHIGEPHADAFRAYCEVTARLFAHVDPMSREWQNLADKHLRLARELCLTPATSTNLIRTARPERKLAKYLAG
jgi:phage terminase small subunit